MQKPFLILGSILGMLFVQSANATIDTTIQMELGNPSGAATDTNNHTHFLIQRSVEAIDYNDKLGEPNWASWDLTASDIGTNGRSSFYMDKDLPANFYKVKVTDYTGSGYDRGHLCPSADRTDDTNDNKAVFCMSNIFPQTDDNNRGPWKSLESYCRKLAEQGNELYIICGGSGYSTNWVNTKRPIYIPEKTWKIVLVVPEGNGNILSRITKDTRVIAVDIPNVVGIRRNSWDKYLTSINEIQAETGYRFLNSLPSDIATALCVKIDGASAPPNNPVFSMEFLNLAFPSALIGAIAGALVVGLFGLYTMRVERIRAERENFQDAFSQLLKLQQKIIEGLRDKHVPSIHGRDCFENWWNALKGQYQTKNLRHFISKLLSVKKSEETDAENITELEIASYCYLQFYEPHQAYLGHYFRNLYHVFKLADGEASLKSFCKRKDFKNRKKFTSLARAQLSQFELALLFYNCLTPIPPEPTNKFKALVEKYGLLENFNIEVLPEAEHIGFYEKSAFGDSKLQTKL